MAISRLTGARVTPRRLAGVAALAGCVAACGASSVVPGSGARPTRAVLPSRSRVVLVLTQTRGYHHASIPWALAALGRLAARDGRYRMVSLPSAAALTPAALKRAVAVTFLLTSGELPFSPTQKRALLAFVRAGGGFVGVHSATDTFHHWPAYLAMVGGEFSHHPLPSSERLLVEDRRTPMTRALNARFTLREEFYVFAHDPRTGAHVLVRLGTRGRRADRPLVWCRRYGRGRVFYDALGHFPQTWRDRRALALMAGGLTWAAGLAAAPRC